MSYNVNSIAEINQLFGAYGWWFAVLFAVLAVWSIIWKGIALWKAARASDKRWFIILLVVNTAGILEIIYIYFIAKKNEAA